VKGLFILQIELARVEAEVARLQHLASVLDDLGLSGSELAIDVAVDVERARVKRGKLRVAVDSARDGGPKKAKKG